MDTSIPPKATFSQILCASAEGASGLATAAVLGYTSAALISMSKDPDFELSEEQSSWIGAIVPGMALVGSLISGHLLDAHGRRRVFLATTIPSILAWGFLTVSSSAIHVILSRLITGLCLGVQQAAVSVYASETIHPKLRQMFSIVPGMTMMAGFVMINVACSMMDWRGGAKVGLYMSVPVLLILLFLPETPYFHLKNGRDKETLETLKWLRNSEKEAENEFKEMKQTSSTRDKDSASVSGVSGILKAPYRWPFMAAILLHVFQQATGISAIMSFMGLIFERAGSSVDPGTCSLVMIIINIGSMFYVMRILHKYPRKLFIRASSLVIIASLLLLSGYISARESENVFWKDLSRYFTIIPLLAFIIFTTGFSLGWGPLPWMFIRDGLPVAIRGKVAGMVIATNWAFNFLITKTFISASALFGSQNVFLFYAFLTFVGMVVMHFYVPETFGMSDAQLEKYLRESYKMKSD